MEKKEFPMCIEYSCNAKECAKIASAQLNKLVKEHYHMQILYDMRENQVKCLNGCALYTQKSGIVICHCINGEKAESGRRVSGNISDTALHELLKHGCAVSVYFRKLSDP